MTSALSKHTIETFGPEIMAILKEAAIERKMIRGTWKELQAFRLRISLLRKAMQREKHELYPIAARVRSQLLFGKKARDADPQNRLDYPDPEVKKYTKNGYEKPRDTSIKAVLILQPADLQYRSLLAQVGITQQKIAEAPKLTKETATVKPPLASEGSGSDDDFLDNLFK